MGQLPDDTDNAQERPVASGSLLVASPALWPGAQVLEW
jgi:hypothetical protein